MEEKEVLVKVEGLSKKFCKDLKTSLKYGVQDLFANFGRNNKAAVLREKEFWAVKDINFELRRGECLGVIGHNGAGKSTLLKILNGLIKPDEGKVTIKGKVSALIELGAGFNPILSGRENIYNNGAVLGFTREEINSKIEEIIDFAEIREFIDMPVQNYSSGMKVRLGFAVAAQMEPDVLIIDEVLAVGDLGFVLKCFKTIDIILPHTAIVVVSHSMPMVSRLCSKIILLEKGREIFKGDVSKGIDLYYNKFVENVSNIVFNNSNFSLKKIHLFSNKLKNGIAQLNWGDNFKLHLVFKVENLIAVPLFRIVIYDKEQREMAIIEPNCSNSKLKIKNNILEFLVIHENLQLSKGVYSVNITAFEENSNNPIIRIISAISFQVLHKEDHFQPFLLSASYHSIK